MVIKNYSLNYLQENNCHFLHYLLELKNCSSNIMDILKNFLEFLTNFHVEMIKNYCHEDKMDTFNLSKMIVHNIIKMVLFSCVLIKLTNLLHAIIILLT